MSRKRIAFLSALLAALLTLAACQTAPGGPTDGTAAPSESATEATPETEPASETEPVKTGTPVKVILLSGQSNAVGYSYNNFSRGSDFTGERLEAARNGYPKVLIRFSNNPFEQAAEPQYGPVSNTAFEPVTFGQGSVSPYPDYLAFGPEVGIAETLTAAYPDETFYIVKCSTSGASLLTRFNPADKKNPTNLYSEMVSFTEGALSDLKAEGLAPEIIAFCWIHGGADSAGNPAVYIDTYKALLDGLKTDLAEYMPENGMSVIDAGIDTISNTNAEALNAAKERFASGSSKRYFFPVTDLKLGANQHFTGDSMVVIGNRFGDCLKTVIETLGEPETLS